MLSPAPVAKKIADRSEGGSGSDINVIKNIDAIKSVTDLEEEDKKKKRLDDLSSDLSGTTIIEDRNNPPEIEGGPVGVVEGSELPTGVDPRVGVLSSDNSSSDSSSTGGSSKSDTDISSSSSDSTRSLVTSDSSDSDLYIASKANRNKMSSSMNKSPICDGERDSFEEWHSKWEVFGQDHPFDKYQCDIFHPDLPVDGHATVTITEDQKNALKKNKKAIASLCISFASTYTVDAMIEATIDDGEPPQWPYGQIHLALKELYDTDRPKSRLDRIQLDIDKLSIKMTDGEHSDVLFEKAMMVQKKYRRRRTKLTWDEVISCVVTGASSAYQTEFTTKILEMDQEPDGQVVLTALKKLGNELYLAGSLSRTNVESSHEMSLIQFSKKKTTTDQWTSGMQCYWCWKLGHKLSNCKRRAAGKPKLPKPGSKITAAPCGGGGGGGGGSKTQAPCGRCKGKHLTKNCYHDPANASKRPAEWIVKTKDVGSVAIDSDSSGSYVKVHEPDFSIIAIERPSQASNNGPWLFDTGTIPTIAEKAVELVTIKPVTVSTLGGEVKLIKPDFSLVAIDSSAAPPESAIDMQLLLIQDRVNSGHVTFPDNFDLLYDKNVWIFNTGGSCNSSGCMDGAVNIRECNSEVIPANGVIIKQSKIGDIPCSKLDKFGNHINYTRINSVKSGKHNTFSLFSANNAMQYDWMCRGDCDRGWTIENEAGDVVNFDIQISTTTSCIWCGYFK
jgi:hypothetical protein